VPLGCFRTRSSTPNWAANGAVTYRDPDGRAMVFAPWVFGRDPEPVDHEEDRTAQGAVRIDWYDGDREAIRPLFAEAEDSPVQLDSYLHGGRVLVARDGTDIVGHLQLVPTEREDEVELKSIAVVATRRGMGIGRALVDVALRRSVETGFSRMVVSTAAADVDNLRLYQRRGFRFTRVQRDAFGPGSGYPDPIVIDGIPLRDRLWLAQELTGAIDLSEPETGETTTSPGELRVVITAPDHDRAVDFYRDALGLRELAAFTDDNGGQATMLDAGRATVEIGDELHADAIDALEVGRRVAGPIRLAFAVPDATDATARLLAGGGKLIAPATRTPWGSVNARLESPDRLQHTVFSDEVTEA
jgi:ribosomal protein S18 acetylase RimI-like enzyme/predicted enzyme related to lactoylglutathione lyase